MIEFLPTLNALLNATSAVLLISGRRYVKAGNRVAHKKIMIAAFTTSILFLISYLIFHAIHGSTKFLGEGISRPIYFTILISHTFLAAFVPFFALFTLRLGLKGKYTSHKKLAKWTYPLWLYVSVTGVVIYILLYRIYTP